MKSSKRISFRIAIMMTFLLSGTSAFCQSSVGFDWARAINSANYEEAFSMAVDHKGNLLLTGFYSTTADFDPDPVDVFTLNSAGGRDVFIQKISPEGDLCWARSMGGTSPDNGKSITVDAQNCIITTGFFQGTADFDPGTALNNLTGIGQSDIFVQKLDSSGNYLWSFGIGGSDYDEGWFVCTDASSNIYISGVFKGTVDFDPGADNHPLTSQGLNDCFVAKYNASGEFQWALSFGNTSADKPFGIAVDPQNNIYLFGLFVGTVDFDPGPAAHVLTSDAGGDQFLLKLNPALGFEWVEHIEASSSITSGSLSLSSNGNPYIAGSFSGTLNISNPAGTYSVTSKGSDDIYLAAFRSDSTLKWASSIGGTGIDNLQSIRLCPGNEILIAGSFANTLDFDPGPDTCIRSSSGSGDAFIATYDSVGNFQLVRKLDGTINEYFSMAAYDAEQNIFGIGRYAATMDFNPGPGQYSMNSGGNGDIFAIKLAKCSTQLSGDTVIVCSGSTYSCPDGTTYANIADTIYHTTHAANWFGCDSINTLSIFPVILNTGVQPNGSTLEAVPQPGEFQWLDCNDNMSIIPSATNVVFQPTADGSFAVSVSHMGCADTSSCIPVVLVSLPDDENIVAMEVFPNPARQKFYISSIANESQHPLTMTIYSATAYPVHSEVIPAINGTAEINIEHLPAGCYIICLADREGVKQYSRLLVIE